jgi:hypothetical protein
MWHHRGMSAEHLTATLAALSDRDLEILRELANVADRRPAGLLAAITRAADWEARRRDGMACELLPLGEAISDGDLDAALGLAVAFHASIAGRFEQPARVRAMIVGVVETIAGTPPA